MKRLFVLFALLGLSLLAQDLEAQTRTKDRSNATDRWREFSYSYPAIRDSGADSVSTITVFELPPYERLASYEIIVDSAFAGTAQDSTQFSLVPNDSHTSFVTFACEQAADSGSTWRFRKSLGEQGYLLPFTFTTTNNTIRLRVTQRGKVGSLAALINGHILLRIRTEVE